MEQRRPNHQPPQEHVSGAVTAEPAAQPCERRFVARARGMFELLAETLGGDHRLAAQSVQRDLRSLAGMRAVPTLAVVRDLANALGWSASVAAEVIAAEVDAPAEASWIAAMREASEWDDVGQLELLGAWLVRHGGAPRLGAVLRARIAATRGAVDEAAPLLGHARELPWSNDAQESVLLELQARIDADLAAGVPWKVAGTPLASERVAEELDAVSALLEEPNPCNAHHPGPRSVRQSAPRAAWCISTVGMRAFSAAALLREPHARRVASHLAARASLMLADVCPDDGAKPCERLVGLLRSRRSRLLLRELAVRIALDGVETIRFDHVDAREFVAACVRFPKCLSDQDMRVLAARAFAILTAHTGKSIRDFDNECHLTRRKLAFESPTDAASAPFCAARAARSEVPC